MRSTLDLTGVSARTRRLLVLGVRGADSTDGGPTPEDLLSRLEGLDDLTNDDLVDTDEQLAAALDAQVALGVDADLDLVEKIVAGIDTVRGTYLTRAVEDETKLARLAELAARGAPIAVVEEEPEPEVELAADTEPVEVDVEVEVELAAEADEDDTEADAPPAKAKTAAKKKVAASAARTNARRPESMRPRSRERDAIPALRASANVPGVGMGADLSRPEDFAEALGQVIRATAGYRGPRVQHSIATLGGELDPAELFGEERTLRRDAQDNERKIMAVTSETALRASGGICAPQQVDYTQRVFGTDVRPFWNEALANFGADRGGIRSFPPVQFTDTTGAIGLWTAATDATPGGATKPCITMTCPAETETLVDAITRCLKIGNFRARFFPEQVAAWTTQVGVAFARYAEILHMTKVGAASTQIHAPKTLGTTRDVLAVLDRAAAGARSHYRLSPTYPFRVVLPDWLLDNMRVDLSREQPGSADERLAVAEATIESWFKAREMNVTWVLDGETGQIFGAQGDGALLGWPSHVVSYMYPEGSWLALNGGQLDLGIVRDSTLNSTNDFQMFAESFEAVHFRGIFSYRIDMDICASGVTVGAKQIDVCGNGS